MGVDIATAALAAGHSVVATARNAAAVTAALGEHDELLAVQLDITDPASVDAAVAAAVDRFGRIDVLVNNAGNFYAGYFEEISPAQMRAQIETNLFGPMNVTRAVLPVMRRQRSGHIVTISSTAGLIGQEFVAAYAASKFGVEGWMESLRFDVEPFGIHTTLVEPGFFRTELLVEGSSTIWPELSIDDYADRTRSTIAAWRGMNGQQAATPPSSPPPSSPSPPSTSRRSDSSPAPTPSPPSSRKHTTCSPRSTPTATCPPTSPTTTSRHDHQPGRRDEPSAGTTTVASGAPTTADTNRARHHHRIALAAGRGWRGRGGVSPCAADTRLMDARTACPPAARPRVLGL